MFHSSSIWSFTLRATIFWLSQIPLLVSILLICLKVVISFLGAERILSCPLICLFIDFFNLIISMLLLLWIDEFLLFLSFEEHDDASNVVYRVFFTLPCRNWLFYDCIAGASQVIFMPKWNDKVDNLLVVEELPDSIWCKNDKLIILIQIELEYLCTK